MPDRRTSASRWYAGRPTSASSSATRDATVVLPAPDSPVNQTVQPLLLTGPFLQGECPSRRQLKALTRSSEPRRAPPDAPPRQAARYRPGQGRRTCSHGSWRPATSRGGAGGVLGSDWAA